MVLWHSEEKKKVSIRNISHGDKSIKPVSVRLGSE